MTISDGDSQECDDCPLCPPVDDSVHITECPYNGYTTAGAGSERPTDCSSCSLKIMILAFLSAYLAVICFALVLLLLWERREKHPQRNTAEVGYSRFGSVETEYDQQGPSVEITVGQDNDYCVKENTATGTSCHKEKHNLNSKPADELQLGEGNDKRSKNDRLYYQNVNSKQYEDDGYCWMKDGPFSD